MKSHILMMLLTLLPGDGETDKRRPEIFCRFTSADSVKVRMIVDGVDVTALAVVSGGRISYVPAEDLAEGQHRVRVEITDRRGRPLQKRWSFVVRPAPIAFVAPTPANGAILNARRLPVRVAVRSAEPVPIFISRNGGAFVAVGSRARFADGLTTLALHEVTSGTCTVRAGKGIYTSFSVDGSPPVLRDLAVDPPVLRSPGTITLTARVEDAPFNEVREIVVEAKLGGRLVERFSGRPIEGLFRTTWTPARLAPGQYTFHTRLTDWAGNTTQTVSRDLMRVSETIGDAAETEINLRLDRIRSVIALPQTRVTGTATPGAEVELFVNGRSEGRTFASGSGAFRFNRVPLAEGRNRISAVATEPSSGRRSREDTITTTLRSAIAVRSPTPRGGTPSRKSRPSAPVITSPSGYTKLDGDDDDDDDDDDVEIAVEGTAEPASEVTVYVNGRSKGTRRAGSAGRFRFIKVSLSEGRNVITARARNAAGQGPASKSVTVEVED